MKKIALLKGFVLTAGILEMLESLAYARGYGCRRGGYPTDPEIFNRIGICWTDPTSSSADSIHYGLLLSMETGNNSEIAADVYTLRFKSEADQTSQKVGTTLVHITGCEST